MLKKTCKSLRIPVYGVTGDYGSRTAQSLLNIALNQLYQAVNGLLLRNMTENRLLAAVD